MGLMGSNGMVFPYLGFLICCTVDCELEIKQWASSTCECTMALGQNILHSCISLNTKLHLYSSCILPIFLYGMETYMWLYRPQRHLTFLFIGVYAEFWMLDCIASNERYNQEPISHLCQTQSTQDVFVYLDTSTELTPSRTTCGHYCSVSQACQRTGKGDMAGQDRHGYEQWRVILAWCLHTSMHKIEQLGMRLWIWIRRWQALDDDVLC